MSRSSRFQGDIEGALKLMTMSVEATSPQDPESLAWHYAQIGNLLLQTNDIHSNLQGHDAESDFTPATAGDEKT